AIDVVEMRELHHRVGTRRVARERAPHGFRAPARRVAAVDADHAAPNERQVLGAPVCRLVVVRRRPTEVEQVDAVEAVFDALAGPRDPGVDPPAAARADETYGATVGAARRLAHREIV